MPYEEANNRTVIFAPLNWGLGHASRIIPLIQKYQKEGWRILVASDGVALKFLQIEFPKIEVLDIKSEELHYSNSKNASLLSHLKKIVPAFLRNIKTDKLFVQQLTKKENIDLIISDNRYGFFHPDVKSIILTHQLQLAIPNALKFGRFFVQKKLNQWLNTFDECWIVDNSEHQFAGKLSLNNQLKIPSQFIGLQSRFNTTQITKNIDFLVILSGLEPQRSILESLIIEVLKNTKGTIVIVGGHFGAVSEKINIEYLSFANTKELESLLNRAKCVISRSGYSSIMDLLQLKKKAILIPTQGQPEQEYLALFHSKNPNFYIADNNLKSIHFQMNQYLKGY